MAGERYTRMSRREVEYLGLGDVIATVTRRLGIDECDGCRRRKEKLNQLAPRVARRRRR